MWRTLAILSPAIGCVAADASAPRRDPPASELAIERQLDDATCAADIEGDARIPLKEAKLIIEHNATDLDTGFQGFVDSDGWACLDVIGPDGPVARFRGLGSLGELGLTELFFESVEPENVDVPLDDLLEVLPEGRYTFVGQAREAGEDLGLTRGSATLTHVIPAGPILVSPRQDAVVSTSGVVMAWEPVTETIDGDPVTIVSYQLIVEKVADPHPHMIGKRGSLSMYLPPATTRIELPAGFLEAGTAYDWEVLAIERSGNQTLSSGAFETRRW